MNTPQLNILSSKQTDFLNENFVVFDPITKKHHTEFNGLLNSQVILMGEHHHTEILSRVQEQFLQLFTGENSCLLIEGLPPGQQVNCEDYPYLSITPQSISIKGSDVRNTNMTTETYLKYKSLQKQDHALKTQCKNRILETTKSIATILNNDLTSNLAVINRQHLSISEATLNETNKLYAIASQIKIESNKNDQKLITESDKIYKRTDQSEIPSGNILKSNQGLFETILEAVNQFDQIIAIWGEAHFLAEDALFEELEKSNICCTTLLPNSCLAKKVKKEGRWKTSSAQPYLLNIIEKTFKAQLINGKYSIFKRTAEYQFTKAGFLLFDPKIQTIMKINKKPLTLLTPHKLNELLSKCEHFTLTSDSTIALQEIDTTDFLAIYDTSDPLKKTEMTNKRILNILNKMLLFHNRRVIALKCEGNVTWSCNFENRKPTLQVSSDQPFSLTSCLGSMQTSATYLFREMRSRNQTEFRVEANQNLILTDTTKSESDGLINNPTLLFDWLSQKSPPHSRVETVGNIKIDRVSNSNGESLNQIALCSASGLSFKLVYDNSLLNEKL